LRRYKNVRRQQQRKQQDMQYIGGALVQWHDAMLARHSLQLVIYLIFGSKIEYVNLFLFVCRNVYCTYFIYCIEWTSTSWPYYTRRFPSSNPLGSSSSSSRHLPLFTILVAPLSSFDELKMVSNAQHMSIQ
jgi:hypothetical protein